MLYNFVFKIEVSEAVKSFRFYSCHHVAGNHMVDHLV